MFAYVHRYSLTISGSWCSSILIDIDQRLHIFIDVHCFSLKLIVFHLGFNGKSKIWTRIYRVNENLDKSFVVHGKLQDFNDTLRKSFSGKSTI